MDPVSEKLDILATIIVLRASNLSTAQVEFLADKLNNENIDVALKDTLLLFFPYAVPVAMISLDYLYDMAEWAEHMSRLSPGALIENVREFRTYVDSLHYQRYFDTMGTIMYTRAEILDMLGIAFGKPENERMIIYYEKAGLPTTVKNAVAQYENSQITLDSLRRAMKLDNASDVTTVLGIARKAAAEVKRSFASDGITLSMEEAHELVKFDAHILDSMTQAEYDEVKAILNDLSGVDVTFQQIGEALSHALIPDFFDSNDCTSLIADPTQVSLTGTSGMDYILGNDHANTIYGGAGNDLIAGGMGDDHLDGQSGSDIYLWTVGDGNDTISELQTSGDTNILIFGGQVNIDDVVVNRDGNDIVFTYSEGGGVRILNWFSDASHQLAEIRFLSNGAVWTKDQLNDYINSGNLLPRGNSSMQGGMSTFSTLFGVDGVQASYRYREEIDCLSSLAAAPTDWASDPSLASIMNGSEIVTAGDFAASQFDIDIAVASMQFDGGAQEQACDLVGSATSASGSYMVSMSSEGAAENFFTDEQRQSAA